MYQSYKIHKRPINGHFPVCSDVSSLPHGLRKWVDQLLQPIAHAQPPYFKDSFALKTLFSDIKIPNNTLLFTANVKSMYTNIRTEPALHHISQLIQTEAGQSSHHFNSYALIEAMEIVFRNNIVQFGDTYWCQTSGTGVGISPTPPWATIYYTLDLNKILPLWTTNIPLYQWFINDVIGIWLCDQCPD